MTALTLTERLGFTVRMTSLEQLIYLEKFIRAGGERALKGYMQGKPKSIRYETLDEIFTITP